MEEVQEDVMASEVKTFLHKRTSYLNTSGKSGMPTQDNCRTHEANTRSTCNYSEQDWSHVDS